MNTKYYPLAQRLLHWAIAFCILFMLFTVFLRMNWMDKHVMGDIIGKKIGDLGVPISNDDAVSVAKGIRGNMWTWHVYIGYVLIGLFTLRMILFSVTKGTLKNEKETDRFKNKLRIWVYRIFYLLLAGILTTGVLIVKGPDSIHKTMEEVHELALYIVLIFVFLHFCGFIIAECTNQKGVISAMINGGNKKEK